MKILACLFHKKPNHWFFERLFHDYEEITRLDYLRTSESHLGNWRKIMPSVRNARARFGKKIINWESITQSDMQRAKIIKNLPLHATCAGDNQRENHYFWREKSNKRKRLASVLFYYYLWQIKDYDVLFVSNYMEAESQIAVAAAQHLNKKIIFLQEGPFGKNFALDGKGFYYQNELPRTIDFYRTWAEKNPPSEEIIKTPPAVELTGDATIDLTQPYVFLPLQNFCETNMLLFNEWIEDIPFLLDLAKKAARQLPKEWKIIVAQEPSHSALFNPQHMDSERFVFTNAYSTTQLLQNANVVLTVNGMAGLQAMFFEKPVITLGEAFYNFDELTHTCHSPVDLLRIMQNPDKIQFNQKDRQAFLAYLMQEYYLEDDYTNQIFTNSKQNQRIIKQKLDLERRPRHTQPSQKRKNLVITNVGRHSAHQQWLRDSETRNWNLLLCDVTDNQARWECEDVIYTQHLNGGRFDSIHRAFQEKPDLCEQYEYVLLIENSMHIACQQINRIFELMKEYDLQIAQPAMAHHGWSPYVALYRHPHFKLRYTNFVDRRIVCIDMALWKKILPLYEDNPNPYYIEFFWHRLTDNPEKQAAILDCVEIHDTAWTPEKGEWARRQQKYRRSSSGPIEYETPERSSDLDEWWHPKIVCHEAVLNDNTHLVGRNAVEQTIKESLREIGRQVNRSQRSTDFPLEEGMALALENQKTGIGEISKVELKTLHNKEPINVANQQAILQKNDALMKNSKNKNLVIVCAKDHTHYPHWLADARNWDMLVSSNNSIHRLRDDVINLQYFSTGKDAVYNAFEKIPSLMEHYEYIFLASDDCEMTAEDITQLFKRMTELDLQIAQPSLAYDSHLIMWQSLHNPLYKVRYTNYVEDNMVCLHRKVLQRVLPLYKDNPFALYIDNFWARLADDPKKQVAIIDDIKIKHAHIDDIKIKHAHAYNIDKAFKFGRNPAGPHKYSVLNHSASFDKEELDKWNLKKIVVHASILKNGWRVKGRRLNLIFLFIGWLKTMKKVTRAQMPRRRSAHKSIRHSFRNQLLGKMRLTHTRIMIHGRNDA